jgi:hypothetical protein
MAYPFKVAKLIARDMSSVLIHKPNARYATVLIVFVSGTDHVSRQIVCMKVVCCVCRFRSSCVQYIE